MFKSWQQSSTTTLLIQFCSMPQKLLQHYRKTRTCKHSHTQTVTHKITCSGNSFGVCKSGTASQRDTAKENAIPLSPFPGGGSAVLRVQISRTPPESPVRMSPLLRKARHCTNLGFSYFFKKNMHTYCKALHLDTSGLKVYNIQHYKSTINKSCALEWPRELMCAGVPGCQVSAIFSLQLQL